MHRLLIISLLTYSCAYNDVRLTSPANRTASFDVKSKHSKRGNFNRLIDWTAITFNDSNNVIKMRDSRRGKIIIRGSVSCPELNLGGGYVDSYLDFAMVVSVKNKSISLKFMDIIGTSTTTEAWDYGRRPSSKQEAEKVINACINPIKDSLVKYVGM